MLGDGINDSAPSAADVGIAISRRRGHSGNCRRHDCRRQPARELVLLKSIANGLQKRTKEQLPLYHELQQHLIVLGAMGILPPATSALLHNASTLGVSLKSMTNLLD